MVPLTAQRFINANLGISRINTLPSSSQPTLFVFWIIWAISARTYVITPYILRFCVVRLATTGRFGVTPKNEHQNSAIRFDPSYPVEDFQGTRKKEAWADVEQLAFKLERQHMIHKI